MTPHDLTFVLRTWSRLLPRKGGAIFLLVLLSLFSLPAHAQLGVIDTGKNKGKPIDITSADLTVKPKENLAIFEGNVLAAQGDFKLRAARMDVHYHGDGDKAGSGESISKVIAQGSVVLTLPDREARADLGVYDVDTGKMELTGHVVLIKDKNRLEGGRFTYDTASGESKLMSDARATIAPTVPAEAGAPGEAAAPQQPQPAGSGRVKGFFVPKGKD